MKVMEIGLGRFLSLFAFGAAVVAPLALVLRYGVIPMQQIPLMDAVLTYLGALMLIAVVAFVVLLTDSDCLMDRPHPKP